MRFLSILFLLSRDFRVRSVSNLLLYDISSSFLLKLDVFLFSRSAITVLIAIYFSSIVQNYSVDVAPLLFSLFNALFVLIIV